YVIGRDFVIEERYADGHFEQVSALIDELLALNIDILLTPGTPITLAAKRATSKVPIICVTGDPIGAGLVTDPSRPGGNVTGLWLFSSDYSATWLELLQEAVPNLHRVAVLWNHENRLITKEIADLRQAAGYLKLDLTLFSTTPTDAEGNLAAIANAGFWRFCNNHRFLARANNPENYSVRGRAPFTHDLPIRRGGPAGRVDLLLSRLLCNLATSGGLRRSDIEGRACGGSAYRAGDGPVS